MCKMMNRAGFTAAWSVAALLAVSTTVRGQANITLESYNASATGELLTGQVAENGNTWINPVAGSADGLVYTYAGNALNILPNPEGGAKFGVARRNVGFARAELAVNWGTGLTTVSYDLYCTYDGVLPTSQNLASFSTQTAAEGQIIHLFQWVDVATGTNYDAAYVVYDAFGAQHANSTNIANGTLPNDNWRNLSVNRWYRHTLSFDWNYGQIVRVSLQDLTNNGPVHVAYPCGWYTTAGNPMGLPIPTGVRCFGGGGSDGNTLAFDNVRFSFTGTNSFVRGDFNNDCQVTALDVPGYAAALLNDPARADITCNPGLTLPADGDSIASFMTAIFGPSATGACCFIGGSCRICSEFGCGQFGGDYQGDGTVCSPNPCFIPPPSNDECTGAIDISCGNVGDSDSRGATENATDPSFACRGGGAGQGFATVWFKFTASNTSAEINTCNSFPSIGDTLLAVYSGTCGSLTQIACNDDSNPVCSNQTGDFTSSVCVYGLTPGQVYYVEVAGFGATNRGGVQVVVLCPANCVGACCIPNQECSEQTRGDCLANGGLYRGDATRCSPFDPCPRANDVCSGAELLVCNDPAVEESNAGATEEATDPSYCGAPASPIFRTLHYKFVATSTTATVTTCGNFSGAAAGHVDTVTVVRDPIDAGNPCNGFNVISCGDDSCAACAGPPAITNGCVETQSLTGLTVGRTYYIVVGSFDTTNTARNSNVGLYSVQVTCP